MCNILDRRKKAMDLGKKNSGSGKGMFLTHFV
jgi:hypothetical protein